MVANTWRRLSWLLNEHFCTCNLYHKTCHVIMLLAAAIRMETCVFAVNTIIWNAIRAEIDWQCGERVKERVWNFVSNHTLASLWNYLWNFNKCSPLNNYTNAFLLLLFFRSLSLSTSSNLSLNIHCLICILCVCDKKKRQNNNNNSFFWRLHWFRVWLCFMFFEWYY